jgi:hypothetical protein
MCLATKAFRQFLPEGGFARTIQETFIILGRVALWRPADLLLYEWHPHKRDISLFKRLEQSGIRVVPYTGEERK